MIHRTFGWIQNPSSTETLKDVLSIFVLGSSFHTFMLEERLPLLKRAGLFKTEDLYMTFQKMLQSGKSLAYDVLKGQGSGGESRSKAKCSGLIQAAITGQQYREYEIEGTKIHIKKPFTDDWTADGFLRWAVSLGFLDYHYDDDTCSITPLGKNFVAAQTDKDKNAILGQAYLSYPPVCRILGLLTAQGHMTKFEIGSQLGFTDEAGFTSFPQNIWVQAYHEATDNEAKRELCTNTEGSSDKYARMICNWLDDIGWVNKVPKTVRETFGSKTYDCTISMAYEITAAGIINYKQAIGKSKRRRIPKIVYREMLASKASDAEYLRMRRALILEFLGKHKPKSIEDILNFLKTKGFSETPAVVNDDMKGLINIGLDIDFDGTTYKLRDNIEKLVCYQGNIVKEKTDAALVKERVRLQLHNINHKYLALIDYAFSGKNNSRDFEVYTIDLLVNELTFGGLHLGGTRKPDGIFYHGSNGIIIDNKAYAKGFVITRNMADEMIRYVQENNDRNPERNPNCWWKGFPHDVTRYNYVFISSMFKGEVEHMLDNIRQSTGIDGCVLTIENLLYYADAIKGGTLSKATFINGFNANKEMVFSNCNA